MHARNAEDAFISRGFSNWKICSYCLLAFFDSMKPPNDLYA